MSRRRRGRPVHGWLIIDKPGGMTSTAVVNKVKWLLDARKAGHGGTLDPMATGMLPIAFGEATKTVSHVMDGSKSYCFTLRWGAETNTDDAEGETVKQSDVRPDQAAVENVLTGFVGRIEQVPPQFSAVKIDGVRAYKLAREDKKVALTAREIDIHDIRIVGTPDADHTEFSVVSGKGAYMRALARDIARAAGGLGHISALRRTSVGPFDADDAISLDELESIGQIAAREQKLLPVETALDDIPALAVTESEAMRLRNGQPVSLLRKVDLQRIAELDNGDTVLAKTRTKPVALVRYAAGEVKPFRVLNL
ncbi:MAG: tRNA pseudouridine(55) synthase TruB [Rhodospirillaceae bacterium]|nr:tRNA pseudouridine(55) synthase TruB [Rhodospirillaceae bacterium]MDD9926279.1 tRNA pseudouridine(55) synthase TruB [Rhodospirillaceae bacterium]